jgi:hypothetical protein
VSIRLNRLRLDRGTILAQDAWHTESMRRDNRSARILVNPKVVATAEGRRSLGQLLAREVSDPRSVERGIIKDMLDPIAAAVTDLLKATLPNRSAVEIHWGYQMMVGTMTFIMLDAGRIRRISGGACDPEDVEATIQHIIPLILDGLRNGLAAKADKP